MKTYSWLVPAITLLAFQGAAQIQEAATPDLVVVDRGQNYRVWQRTITETLPDGETIQRRGGYVELSPGVHYLKEGSWAETKELIEIFQDGAIARQGPHQVIFANNINSIGTVDLLSSDGKRFRSHLVGLAYTDAASGKSELIAEPKDSIGALAGPNQVVYQDALNGPFRADVAFLYTAGGFEQFVILAENPPPPADYGCDPSTTYLEVWTEFIDAPEPVKRFGVLRVEEDPVKRRAMVEPDLTDEFLDFGAMCMVQGSAFPLDAKRLGEWDQPGTVSGKSWLHINGRTFLVEKVDYSAIKDQLARLPKAALAVPKKKPEQLVAARPKGGIQRQFPSAKRQLAAKASKPVQMARARLPAKGFVVDYSLLNSMTNFTFQGDTTYYVTNKTVTLSGTTTFEGGTVVKYSTNWSLNRLLVTGPIDCRTSRYRPAFFIPQDDNTVGDIIAGSTGNPGTNRYAGRAIELNAASTTYDLHDLRFRNVDKAITLNASSLTYTLSHSQISLANIAFYNPGTLGAKGFLRNLLAYDLLTGIYMGSSTNYCEHITFHRVKDFRSSTNGAVSVTNSLLIAVTNNLTYVGSSADVITNLSDSGVFQTVGAATHYLATNSSYRNAGTTNVNPGLAGDIKWRTTYPPVVLTNSITNDTVLTAQAQRDSDTPDLGYHYDCLDFVANQISITNATLTLQTGTALGVYGSNNTGGLLLLSGSKIVSEGSPTNLNRIVRYNTVQEQANTNWAFSTVGRSIDMSTSASTEPQARFRFTDWSIPAGIGYHFNGGIYTATPIAFQDSQFSAGDFNATKTSVSLTNCLCNRLRFNLDDKSSSPDHYFYNNLFRGGSMAIIVGGAGNWLFRDNLFDQTSVNQVGVVTHDHNGYVTNCNRLTNNQASDIVMTNSPVYQAGALGFFYYPTNDGMLSLLFNAGSRNATNAGLFHFTTVTNNVKETNSTVDIGFHYIALNAQLNAAADTDGDGIPDYQEDANGNGSVDSGETDWKNAGDSGLRVFITRPRNGNPIP